MDFQYKIQEKVNKAGLCTLSFLIRLSQLSKITINSGYNILPPTYCVGEVNLSLQFIQ